jgi:tellurite resistance protein TehA-like permease
MAKEEEKPLSNPEIKDIYKVLGKIDGRLEQMANANGRTTLALIGVIAAQIGVKILGTPILLDIATTIGIVGIFLLLGVIVLGWRIFRDKKQKLTTSGKLLVVMITTILITQVLVYFRDLGTLNPSVIYVFRIVQNTSIGIFAWRMMVEHDILCDRESTGQVTK